MKISTTRFGEVEFPEEVLIHFPEGILGFPEMDRYVLLEHDIDNSPFKWLQSVDSPDLAFIVMDPALLAPDYSVMIDSDTARVIRCADASRLAFVSILNIPSGNAYQMTANLKAPLAINPDQRLGRQVILGSQTFSVQEPVFPRLNERLNEMHMTTHAATA